MQCLAPSSASAFLAPARAPPAPARPSLLPGCAARNRRTVRCAAAKEEPKRRKSVEELAGQQLSAAEPGGEVGRQDPGSKLGVAATGPEALELDAGLRSALLPLLAACRARLAARGARLAPRAVAEAAVASAEASGALPPLAGPQRSALEGFLERLAGEEGLAGATGKAGEGSEGFEDFGSSGGEALFGEEDAVLRVRPHARELMQAVLNAHLGGGGGPRASCGPADSVKAGGDVGNLAWHGGSSGGASSGGGGGEVHGVPAESGADRAERQAEGDFERLELMNAAHAPDADEEASLNKGRAAHRAARAAAASAAIDGDAPAAGDGAQIVE